MLSIIEAAAVIGLGVLGLKMAFDASSKLRKNHSTMEAKMIGIVPINIQGKSCQAKSVEETPAEIRSSLRESSAYGLYSGVSYDENAVKDLRKHYLEERSAVIVPMGTKSFSVGPQDTEKQSDIYSMYDKNNMYDIWVTL
jgi:hypothetical protein